MAKRKQTYKRRQFLVKRDFQTRFISQFCLLIFGSALISTGMILYFSSGSLTSMFSQSRLMVTDTALYLLPTVVYANLVTIVIIAVATMLVMLFISHKIAGPLFRFEKDVKAIADGDLTLTIWLRKKDQLRELAQDINQMTSCLNRKVREIQTELEKIIHSASEEGAPQWFRDELELLSREIGENFKLEKPEPEQRKH